MDAREVSYPETHRLVSIEFSNPTVTLSELELDEGLDADLAVLYRVTDERAKSEQGTGLAISAGELLIGVPEAAIVNAAFCFPSATGSRFNDKRRGAWYASVEPETAIAEVAYHRHRFLRERSNRRTIEFPYQEFLADFYGQYVSLTPHEETVYLQPAPIPDCYAPGQAFARMILELGRNGIVYRSVRHAGGTCIVCFRPALVFHPRRGSRLRLTVHGDSPALLFEVNDLPQ